LVAATLIWLFCIRCWCRNFAKKTRFLRIPLIVTDDSGIVTVHSGDRDRRLEQAGHSAL